MSKLDEAIREALSTDEAEQLETLVPPKGLFGLMGLTLTGTNGIWAMFGIVIQLATFALAVWCGWNLYIAETGREMALWGMGFGLFSFWMGIMKLWFLLQMDKQELLREIKRLELQLALVAQQMG